MRLICSGDTIVAYGSFCFEKTIEIGGKTLKEYLTKYQDVLQEHQTSEEGLTAAEVQAREAKYGKNKLAEGKKELSWNVSWVSWLTR